MQGKNPNMKPQDVVILFKILSLGEKEWNQQLLSRELGISQSEISESLRRSNYAGLLNLTSGMVNRRAFYQFIVNGIKFVFPQRPGPIVKGIPTAHSAPILRDEMMSEEQYVWPLSNGYARGQAIIPLYKTVPIAIQRDDLLYDYLALVDAIRVGRTRENNLSKQILQDLIKNA
jgi:predicted transcriptional regulator